MSRNQRVLIVDHSAECREVFRTALERAGAKTVEASTAAEGLRVFHLQSPDLVVLDVQDELALSGDDSVALQEAAEQMATPIVILGKARLPMLPGRGVHWIEKPYHFAPLIRRIEGLLSARSR